VAETRIEAQGRHRIAGGAREEGRPPQPPRAEASGFDALLHERTRLAMVGALAARERLSFAELKAILKTTDGNVSAHARKLEDAGYIVSHKRFEGRMPRTEYELTEAGRRALNAYLDHMERLISSMRQP
jgi:DNA-binding transcriptional ArsR family regulator